MIGKVNIFIESLKIQLKNRQAFGIEIERQDLNCGEVINLERDTINIVASNEKKAKIF